MLSIGGYPDLPGMVLVDPVENQFEGQIVYLDFDGEQDVTYNGPVVVEGIDIPAFEAPGGLAGQEQEIIDQIVAELEKIYADTGITFTTEQPTTGMEYSTIYFGGDCAAIFPSERYLGLSEQNDVHNLDLEDKAFVFVEDHVPSDFSRHVADTAVHELGHLIGYVHVADLYSTSPLSDLALSAAEVRVEGESTPWTWGDNVLINFDVANTGSTEGYYDIKLGVSANSTFNEDHDHTIEAWPNIHLPSGYYWFEYDYSISLPDSPGEWDNSLDVDSSLYFYVFANPRKKPDGTYYGGFGLGSDQIRVYPANVPPEADRFYPSGMFPEVDAGDSLTVTVRGRDDDGNLSRVRWYSDGTFVCQDSMSGPSMNARFTEQFDASHPTNTHEITAIVYDTDNEFDAETWYVKVRNDSPSASRNGPLEEFITVSQNDTMTFTVHGFDREGALTKTGWWSGGQFVSEQSMSGLGDTTTFTETFSEVGAHAITAIVYDAAGQWDSVSWHVTVEEVETPNAAIIGDPIAIVPTGLHERGDVVEMTVTVQNTGNVAHSFWVGHSLEVPNSGDEPDYYDVPPQQTQVIPVGGTEVITFEYAIPAWLPPSSDPYEAVFAVWESYDRPNHVMDGAYHRPDPVPTFRLGGASFDGGSIYEQLLAMAQDVRWSGDLQQYVWNKYDAGEKLLLAISGSLDLADPFSFGFASVGPGAHFTILFDLADFLGVTPEGQDNDTITTWIDTGLSINYSVGLPITLAVVKQNFKTPLNADDRTDVVPASGGLGLGVVNLSLDWSARDFGWIPEFKWNVAFGTLGFTYKGEAQGLASFEFSRSQFVASFGTAFGGTALMPLSLVNQATSFLLDMESLPFGIHTPSDGNWAPDQPGPVSPVAGAFVTDETITLRATPIQDRDGDLLYSSEWMVWDDYGFSDTFYDTGNEHVFVPGTLASGKAYHWKVRYQDNRTGDQKWSGWSGTASFVIPGTGNDIPEAIIDNSPSTAQPPDAYINFSGHGVDSGGIEAYKWSSDRDGLLSNQENFSEAAYDLTVGTHVISFQVKDDDGAWSAIDTAILVVSNAVPTANWSNEPSGSLTELSSVLITLGGADNDELDQMVETGELRLDGHIIASPEVGDFTFGIPSALGEHTLSWRVQDDENTWSDPISTTFTVIADPPPTVESFIPGDSSSHRSIISSLNATFSEDVSASLTTESWTIENPVTDEIIDPLDMAVSYNTSTNMATWTFPGLTGGRLPDGNYKATLLAERVTDTVGNPLDSDYPVEFFTFFGDADGDRDVDFADLFKFRKTYQKDSSDPAFNPIFDVDADDDVDGDDLSKFQENYQGTLEVPFEIVVSTESLTVSEGNTTEFTVTLSTEPIGTITVTTARTNGDEDLGIDSGATLTFDSTNWNIPRPVIIAAAWDADIIDSTAEFAISAEGATNRPTVIVTEDDNGALYTVNSLEDVVAIDGFITLREALEASNTNTAVGDAPTGSESGMDVITFRASLFDSGPAAIILNGIQLEISDDVDIQGPSAELLTIDANGQSRVFYVGGTGNVNAMIDGIRITGGSADWGGGIFSLHSNTVTITNSIVSGNVAESGPGGGIFCGGSTLVVSNSIIQKNSASKGGGISNDHPIPSDLIITSSTITGNSAQYGGGIYGMFTLTVASSTFSGNSASIDGGGIYNYGDLTITNSTLSGNTASRNGGGIFNNDTLSVTNSILCLNIATAPFQDAATTQTPVIFSNNLYGLNGDDPMFVRNPSDGGDGWGDDPATPSIDESANDDYGDLRLMLGSPAIDAGDNTLAVDPDGNPLITDLAGNPRIQNAIVDTGAYEYQPVFASLSELIDSDSSIVSGHWKFDQFEYSMTGDMPSAESINVIDIVDGNGNHGISFRGTFTDLFSSSGNSDALIDCRVTSLDPSKPIIGAELTGNPYASGNALMQVTESFLPTTSEVLEIYSPGPPPWFGLDFQNTPYPSLDVQNSISALAMDNGDVASLSFIDLTFIDSVSVPATPVAASMTMETQAVADEVLPVETMRSSLEPDALPYDLDNDGKVDLGDLAFFASVYREQPGITTESPYAYAADFDRSGTVDLGDLAIFSAAYQLSRSNDSAAPQTALTMAAAPALLPGDANRDGTVNEDDAAALARNWQKQTAATWVEGDFNADGLVDDLDAAILARHWMMSVDDMDDDDERDAIFAEVGTADDPFGLFDE